MFSIINILGLSVGMACCFLLVLFIRDELSYDKGYDPENRIYRVAAEIARLNGQVSQYPCTSPPIAFGLQRELPEIENTTRVISLPQITDHLLRYNEKSFYERGFFVDSTFFDLFPAAFLEGSPSIAMDEPSVMVLEEHVSKKIFGNKSALNEMIIVHSGMYTDTFRITGVFRKNDLPSHLDADFYMSYNNRGWGRSYFNNVTTWFGENTAYTYIKVNPGSDKTALTAKINSILKTHGGSFPGATKRLFLQSFHDIHLYSNFTLDIATNSNVAYLYIAGSIALFILFIACINFINLTTAKSAQRSVEVGVRKTLGANRAMLFRQFMGESLSITILSGAVAILIAQVLLPFFNEVTGKTLSFSIDKSGSVLLLLIPITLLTAFVAGSYPAIFLSSFQPTQVIRHKKQSSGLGVLRSGLVIFQFMITILLLSGAVIILQQLSFINNKTLGFSPESTVVIPLRTEEAQNKYEILRTEIEQRSEVKSVSATTSPPSTSSITNSTFFKLGASQENAVLHDSYLVDEDYFKCLSIGMFAGRSLSRNDSTARDIIPVILNITSLKKLDIPLDQAVGQQIYSQGGNRRWAYEIVGVVDDYHQNSLHREVRPMSFFILSKQNKGAVYPNIYMVITLLSSSTDALSKMQETWNKYVKDTPYENFTLTENIGNQYKTEQQMFKIITAFTFIAVVIACLGLYGLSVHVTERRIKEIGIRKIMGASANSIVALLSMHFTRLIVIAILVACPTSYYIMNKWLGGFAYRVQINLFVFLVSGLAAFGVAWLAMSVETLKAANKNPAESLKYE